MDILQALFDLGRPLLFLVVIYMIMGGHDKLRCRLVRFLREYNRYRDI